MKIIFFDSLLPKGHSMINQSYINNFDDLGYNVIIAGEKKYNDYGNYKYIGSNWEVPYEGNDGLTRNQSVKNFIILSKLLSKIEFDYIYIASYDICVFWFVYFRFLHYKDKIILQEHNNIDQLTNSIKYLMYSFYKNSFKHFVFESYFADRLIELGVKKYNLHIVPHCCGDYNGILNNNKNIISLSNSNDQQMIKDIINLENKSGFLQKNNIKLLIKVKEMIEGSKSISIVRGWISDDELNSLYDDSTYVLLLFPNSYSYRVSAVFMEAISRNKYIISSKFKLVEYYKENYPGICSVFENFEMIPNKLLFEEEAYKEDKIRFLYDHSDEKIKKEFSKFFVQKTRKESK